MQIFGLQVESCNRFMSLSSKPISARTVQPLKHAAAAATEKCGQSRVDFYQTFSMLIKMGNPERQGDLVNCRRQVINVFLFSLKNNVVVLHRAFWSIIWGVALKTHSKYTCIFAKPLWICHFLVMTLLSLDFCNCAFVPYNPYWIEQMLCTAPSSTMIFRQNAQLALAHKTRHAHFFTGTGLL